MTTAAHRKNEHTANDAALAVLRSTHLIVRQSERGEVGEVGDVGRNSCDGVVVQP